MVQCADEAPDNATSTLVDVEIFWDGEAWSEPKACSWTCDEDFGPVGDDVCADTQSVPCTDDAPTGATAIVEDVSLSWTGTEWSEPAACDWTCDDPDKHRAGDTCIGNVEISWCNSEWPTESQTRLGSKRSYRGRVYSTAGTEGAGQLPGITAMVCHSYQPLVTPVDLTTAFCAEGEYLRDVDGDQGMLSDDEYEAHQSYETIGVAHYFWAFSGDGGQNWTFCDQNGILGADPNLGRAAVFGPYNGNFEEWNDDDTLPLSWTAGNAVGVERDTTIAERGTSAARLTRLGTDNARTEFSSTLQPIIAGIDYRLEMYALDNDPNARAMMNFQWYDKNGASLANATFTNLYTSDSPQWQTITRLITAPADAASIRVAIRVYGQSGGTNTGGVIIIDDLTINPVVRVE